MEHSYPWLFYNSIWRINLSVVAMTWLSVIIVAIVVVAATRRLNMRKPGPWQNLMEWIHDFVRGQAGQMMEMPDAERYLSLGLTLIVFLFVANWLGLMLNIVFDVNQVSQAAHAAQGWKVGDQISYFLSPTANMFAALGLSLMVVLYTHFLGLRQPKAYFKHLMYPSVAMLPLNLIEELAKVLTLGMRLYGNIFAGEVLIYAAMKIPALFHIPIDVIPLFVWLGYSGFVSTIQAFIFTLLTFAYINQKLFREAH